MIRTKGHVGARRSEWFDAMEVVESIDGTTVIRCLALDQAGLHGLIRTIRDLGLALISVTPIEPDGAGDPGPNSSDIR
ncbi:MAG TPA: hypothetical protein VGO64_04415 [Candidatus Limnocylindrales bacterium]|nr:hypothetical protein [Candidatus Limnocylindrales bacterium]